MAVNTKIQWAHHTFNPWRGCTKVSAGCQHCYAETMSHRNPGTLGVWGPNGTRVVASESMWREPLKWDKAAKEAGERRRVFCASLADVFEDWQGPIVDSRGEQIEMDHRGESGEAPAMMTMQDIRNRLFRLIDRTPNLNWLLVTKRPENIVRMMPAYFPGGYIAEAGTMNQEGPRPNVWIGTSVEDQATADERIPHLLRVPAAMRFLSVEPLLGPVDLRPKAPDAYGDLGQFYDTGTFDPLRFPPPDDRVVNCFPRIHWVLIGGESGPNARRCSIEWIRSIVQQCKAAGAPYFIKQLGSWPTGGLAGEWVAVGARMAGRGGVTLHDSKGGDPEEWPKDLRVREMP